MKQVEFLWVERQTPEGMSEYVNARLKKLNYKILDIKYFGKDVMGSRDGVLVAIVYEDEPSVKQSE